MRCALTTPSSDATDALAAWTARFAEATIPVCSETALGIESARRDEDRIDANRLGELIAADPLMTLRLMAHVARLRGPRQLGDPQTVTAAIVWMGIGPFFRAFSGLETIEQRLDGRAAVLRRVTHRIAQVRRAARVALEIAAQRSDPEAPLLHQAALLDDFGGLLLWVHEPDIALKLEAAASRLDPSCAAAVERDVLGFELADLQQSLSRTWRLPAMLERVTDPRRGEEPGVRTVLIALRLAANRAADVACDQFDPTERLSRGGLAATEDLDDLADLLGIKREEAAALVADLLG